MSYDEDVEYYKQKLYRNLKIPIDVIKQRETYSSFKVYEREYIMSKLKDMLKDGKKVNFIHYRKKELWYKTECGFEFPVPIEDCGDATFLPEDKAMLFMRYIRKHIALCEKD